MLSKIDAGFVYSFIDADFGLPIAHENGDYTPDPETPYSELKVFLNKAERLTMGGANAKDLVTGFFQIVLRYPSGSGAVKAKLKADEIFAVFPTGRNVVYDGQGAEITSVYRWPGFNEAGWYKIVLRVQFIAKVTRG